MDAIQFQEQTPPFLISLRSSFWSIAQVEVEEKKRNKGHL